MSAKYQKEIKANIERANKKLRTCSNKNLTFFYLYVIIKLTLILGKSSGIVYEKFGFN